MRHLACTACKAPYDPQTGKREIHQPRNYFQEKGLCEPCQGFQKDQINSIPKKPVVRECPDIAWATTETRLQ